MSIPIITFFLGIIFTLVMKKRESKREIINRNINEICDHVNEWYNQIHALFVDIKFDDKQNPIEKKIFAYEYNRLILPKLIRNLETLKKYDECQEIVSEVEYFLGLVTCMHHLSDSCNVKKCLPPSKLLALLPSTDFSLDYTNPEKYERLLMRLDSIVQKINKNAAKLSI